MAPSVASLTVAYNAERRLPRQIEALTRQTHPLQEIVVVDKASTDGTTAMLAQRYPQVTVLQMPENIGAAGAWAAGLSYAALQKRHDWVWNFDDDSVPEADTLQNLVNGLESLGNTQDTVGISAPMPVHRDTGTHYPPNLWRDGFVKPSSELLRQPIWLADLVIFSGCMVRREMVETIGLPRADFFMDFFDFEYCLRARSHGYNIAVINGATLGHEIGNARRVRLPGYRRLWAEQTPWREYYISRNVAYTAWWLYPTRRTKKFVLIHLMKHAGAVFLFSSKKLTCLKRMAQGFRDGRRKRLGVRFLPDGKVR